MAVRVIKGREILKEAFKTSSHYNLLIERWNGLSQKINIIAKKSISDFMKAKGEQFRTSENGTVYYFFLKYLAAFKESGKEEDIYTWNNYVDGKKLIINFVVTKTHQKLKGKTDPVSMDNVINVFLEESKFGNVVQNIADKNIALKSINELVSDMEGTLSHELRHYFQLKKGELKRSDITNKPELMSHRLLPFVFFCYFVKNHELEAFVSSVYNLYRRNKKRKISFFNCLVSKIMERLSEGGLREELFAGRMNFKEMLDNLCAHHKFIIEWIVFCYIPMYSQFEELLTKEMKDEDKIAVDSDLLDGNKNNLETFFNNLSISQKEKFDKLLRTPQTAQFYDKAFSTERSNKETIERILDGIR